MPRRSARLAAKPKVDYRKMAGMKSRSKKPVAKLAALVRRAVTALVKGNMETKYSFAALNSTSFNSAITATTEWYNCLPDVKSGLAPYQRVGNRIQPTSLRMSWAIGFNPEVTRSCDNYVVLYVFKLRSAKSFDSMVVQGDPSIFLDQGSGGLTGFSGYTQQLITPINKERYILVHKKIIHLQKGIGLLNNNGQPATDWYNGNGNKSAALVNLTVKVPRLVYDEDTPGNFPVQPNNFGLAWAIGYAHTDMAVPDNIYQDIQVTQTSQLYYKDA